MQIPLDFWNVSLWLAVTGIILLITAQLASAYEGKATILVDQKKLRTTALVIGILFLVTVAIRIYGIVTST
jgi:Ni,Fe-hydrogenase I cytochrome b subunit